MTKTNSSLGDDVCAHYGDASAPSSGNLSGHSINFKELQDKAWASLPEQTRHMVYFYYTQEYSPDTAAALAGAFNMLFGRENITHVLEPSTEIPTTERCRHYTERKPLHLGSC